MEKDNWTAEKLRKVFIEYFKSKDHKEVDSSSVLPTNDDTLLFTNSGMVQFKQYFLDSTLNPVSNKIVSVQHCIRAGGKHNDLDDVGKDNYHHTFFEMMGNWSFGAYFKEEAIDYAYDFLVNKLKIDKERLYVTVYDEMDKESRKIWGKYFPSFKIVKGDKKDNFWEMGEYGPCGPCTEIHYDRIGNRDASALVNMNVPDVLEIWNIVFMECEKKSVMLNGCFKDEMVSLKRKCIDTGIGLERLLSILNNKNSNYLTQSFLCIIKHLEKITNKTFKDDSNNKEDVAFRVIADHARTIGICLYYKLYFNNEGVGYVLRRILRRGVRYGKEILGLSPGVLKDVVKIAVKESLNLTNFDHIDFTLIDNEEKLFLNTLDSGLIQLRKMTKNGRLNSKDVFTLYDTFGFPTDLTKIIADEESIKINFDGLEKLIQDAKERSRAGSNSKVIDYSFNFSITDDSFKYSAESIEASLQCILENDKQVSYIPGNKMFVCIFDRTNFYAQRGGQVGDKGKIIIDQDTVIDVTDTQSMKGYIFHYCKSEKEIKLTGNEKFSLEYDKEARFKSSCNHTSLHLFGHYFENTHKDIKGVSTALDDLKSTYDYEYTHDKMSNEIVLEAEDWVNKVIKDKLSRNILFFNSKEDLVKNEIEHFPDFNYPKPIRVVEYLWKSDDGGLRLWEACGGTHVENTESLKKFIVVKEGGIKTNTRRLTFVTGDEAIEVEKRAIEMLKKLENKESVNSSLSLPLRYRSIIEERNEKVIREKLKELTANIKKLNLTVLDDISKDSRIISNCRNQKIYLKELTQLNIAPKKVVIKAINEMIKKLVDANIKAIIYSEAIDNKKLMFIRAFIDLEDSVKETLVKKFPGFCFSKDKVYRGYIGKDELEDFISIIQ